MQSAGNPRMLLFPKIRGIFRMQLDTAMRINALTLVPNREKACEAVLGGVPFHKLKDGDGNQLRDGYLRQKLAEKHEWVTAAYKQSSDYIHLSESHFRASMDHVEEEPGVAFFLLGQTDPKHLKLTYLETTARFFDATRVAWLLALAQLLSRRRE